MPSRLSSLLVRDGLVGVRRMEKAFQRQVIYGGSLDTILLELGMVPEERLCQYLALASGLPPAARAEIEQIDPAAVGLLKLDVALAYRAIPLVIEGEALRMAVCSPIDLAALEDLADQIDRPLRPLLVPEYRWHLMLATAYGASVPQRYAALASQIEKNPASQPVGRARTIIVENEPERDTIVAATAPPLPPATTLEESVRARASRVTEDVAPLIPRASAGGEFARGAGASASAGTSGTPGTAPGPRPIADEAGEPIVDAPQLPGNSSATMWPADHSDTPPSTKRRRGVTLIGVSPVHALSDLGPQGDLFNDMDLSPASGIPQHVRGELGDDDLTPPPRRVTAGGRRVTATEMMFPTLVTTTPAGAETTTVDGEDPEPLPPAPPAPARSKTAPMPAVQSSSPPDASPRAVTAWPSQPQGTSNATGATQAPTVPAAPARPERRITENPASVPPARAATAPMQRPATETQPRRVEAALESLRSEPSFTASIPAAISSASISIRDARELLTHAEHRDEVFIALLRAVRHVAQWAGLLTVQGGVAIGRLALAHPELDTEQISTVLIPLDAPSPIRTALSSKRLYVGPLAKGDPAVDSMFLRMGGIRPPSLAVLPLVLRERVVALVAAHRADRDITFGDVSELLPLAALATEALGRLILRSKTDTSQSGRSGTMPPGSRGFAPRARTDTTPDELMPYRAATQQPESGGQDGPDRGDPGDRADTEPNPEDPEPEPRRTRPMIEIVADAEDEQENDGDGDNDGLLGDDAEADVDGGLPRGWHGHITEGVVETSSSSFIRPPARARGRVSEAPWRARATSAQPSWAKSERPSSPSQPAPVMRPSRPAYATQAPVAAPSSSGAAPAALTVDVLIELIEQRDAAAMEPAIDEAIARTAEILPALAERFPGTLDVDRYAVGGRPLRAAQYGGLLELITRMGSSVAELLIEKMSAPSRDVRFYAAVCLLELRPRSAIPTLFERLFDPDFGVRACVIEALQGYPSRELESALVRLRQALHGDDPNRVAAAASAVAELADRDSLVDLLAGLMRGERIAEPCRRALMSLTKQDFGLAEKRWQKWWDDHHRRHRIEWMIDGLTHRDSELRFSSIADLRRLTGESFGYEPEAPKRDREIAHRRWLTWWNEAGRIRFVAQDNERHRPTALLPLRRD